MVKQTDYNSVEWKDHFYLDSTSPSGIKWLYSPRNGMSIGAIAGNTFYKANRRSAWQVMLKGKSYMVHRVIWIMINGHLSSDLIVDHLDGNPFDNSVSNLCCKTVQKNNRNKKKHRNNTSGHTGVCIDVKAEGFTYFCAIWRSLDGNSMCKRFRIEKYGHDQAKALAVAYRAEQISLLNAAGASYTERHMGLTPAESPATSSVQPT